LNYGSGGGGGGGEHNNGLVRPNYCVQTNDVAGPALADDNDTLRWSGTVAG